MNLPCGMFNHPHGLHIDRDGASMIVGHPHIVLA